jgi:hypothetical protein
MIVHTCNPSYTGGGDRDRRSTQSKKVRETPPSQQTSQAWFHTPIILDTQEVEVGDHGPRPAPGKK